MRLVSDADLTFSPALDCLATLVRIVFDRRSDCRSEAQDDIVHHIPLYGLVFSPSGVPDGAKSLMELTTKVVISEIEDRKSTSNVRVRAIHKQILGKRPRARNQKIAFQGPAPQSIGCMILDYITGVQLNGSRLRILTVCRLFSR